MSNLIPGSIFFSIRYAVRKAWKWNRERSEHRARRREYRQHWRNNGPRVHYSPDPIANILDRVNSVSLLPPPRIFPANPTASATAIEMSDFEEIDLHSSDSDIPMHASIVFPPRHENPQQPFLVSAIHLNDLTHDDLNLRSGFEMDEFDPGRSRANSL